jgi:uncharacterized membrane protein
MASAVQAFSDAFSSYKELAADYAIYSVITAAASAAISLFAAICLAIFGIFSLGSVASVFASDGSSGIGAAGVGLSLLALFICMFIVLFVSSGLNGAYLATMNLFIAKRKQSLGAFFMLVPKYATNLMLLSIICGVLIGVPFLLSIVLLPALGSILSIVAMLFVVFYAMAAAFLLVFAVPAAVVDSKDPISAIKVSVASCLRNIPSVFAYFAIAFLLFIPALLPLFNLLYLPLFYMPIATSALLRLYRTAH